MKSTIMALILFSISFAYGSEEVIIDEYTATLTIHALGHEDFSGDNEYTLAPLLKSTKAFEFLKPNGDLRFKHTIHLGSPKVRLLKADGSEESLFRKEVITAPVGSKIQMKVRVLMPKSFESKVKLSLAPNEYDPTIGGLAPLIPVVNSPDLLFFRQYELKGDMNVVESIFSPSENTRVDVKIRKTSEFIVKSSEILSVEENSFYIVDKYTKDNFGNFVKALDGQIEL